MSTVSEVRQLLEDLTPSLEAQGYRVYVEPPRQLLPQFMEGYIPDAIALGHGKNLAIEVKVEGVRAPHHDDRSKRRFDNVKDWELLVYYVRPSSRSSDLSLVDGKAIESSIVSVEKLVSIGQPGAALLIGWATFEALARALSPDRFRKPQTAAQLVEVLAGDGLVTPSEADLLRVLGNSRNRLIHGNLDQSVTPGEVTGFIAILRTLHQML